MLLLEDYYPTVATNALMRMLRDPTQTTHQRMCVEKPRLITVLRAGEDITFHN